MRRLVSIILLVLAAVGLVVRFTCRDSIEALAPLFYALPVPLVGVMFLACGCVARRKVRLLAVVIGLVTLGIWFVRDYGFAKPQEGTWKFATWNLQGPRQHPFPPLVDLVRREQPDFIALIETRSLGARAASVYEQAMPGYHMAFLGDDRACLVRGSVSNVEIETFPGRSRITTVRINIRGQKMRVIVVDLDSNPFLSRKPALEWLAYAGAQEPRTVVLGDFNTPMDSELLDPMRPRFGSATEARHAGFRETWFYGLPLLSLDQIWLSRDLRPVFARRVWTLVSDHAPVVASFALRY